MIFSSMKNSSLLLLSLGLLFLSAPLIQADSTNGCWLKSYGRGVGKPISVCGDGLENNAGLCYPPCQSGYNGVGPVCWQNCPAGFPDTGVDCLKPAAYGRGAGYAIWDGSKCQNDHPQGCEKWGAMWYPICGNGFHPFGCCVCTPNCINGMTDVGISCQKQAYGRGVGKPMVCPSDKDEDAALCYNKCKAGYTGDGPVCWNSCPTGMYQCGAVCVDSKDTCVGDMMEVANQVLNSLDDIYGHDDEEDEELSYHQSGVNILAEMATWPICNN